MKWLKIVGYIFLVLIIAVVSLFAWARLEYGPNPIIPHKRITITLPFGPQDQLIGINPLGEKEEVHPGGHGGIDFQWDHGAPLIATSDGTITNIKKAKDGEATVLYVTLKSGQYQSTYKELDKVAEGVKVGSKLKQGEVVGYPHCTFFADSGGHTSCQLHWEFAYASPLPTLTGMVDRLCPLTYFDDESRARITAIWDSVTLQQHANKANYPYICNDVFYNHDQ